MRTVQLLLTCLSAWAVLASGQSGAITSNPAVVAALASARKSITGPGSVQIHNALPQLATQVDAAQRNGFPKKPAVDAAVMRLEQQTGKVSAGNKVAVERAMGSVYDTSRRGSTSTSTDNTRNQGMPKPITPGATTATPVAYAPARTGTAGAAVGSMATGTSAAAAASTVSRSAAATESPSSSSSSSSLSLAPAPAPAPLAPAPAPSGSKLSPGTIAGIVIACVLGPLLLVAMLVLCCMWQRKSAQKEAKAAGAAADAKVIDTAEPVVKGSRSGKAGAYSPYAKTTDADALTGGDRDVDVKLDTDQLHSSNRPGVGTGAAVAGGLGAAGVAAAAATRGSAGRDTADADVALDMSQLRSAHLHTPTDAANADLVSDTRDQGSSAYKHSGATAGAAAGAAGLGAAGLAAGAAGRGGSNAAAGVDTSQLRSAHLHGSMKESAENYPRSMYPNFEEDASTQLSASPPPDRGVYLHQLAEPTPPSSLQNYPAMRR